MLASSRGATRVLFRWPRRIGGGIAGSTPTRRSAASGAWLAGSLQPPASPAAAARRRARGADLRGPRRRRVGGRGWSPARPASRTQTVWKVLRRHGLSRRPRGQRGAPNRYEWPCPGDLLHMDVCTLRALPPARASRDRRSLPARSRTGWPPRPASATTTRTRSSTTTHAWPTSSCTTTRRAATVTAFVERALAFFAGHGISARRLMTDNAFTYIKNRSLRELLAAHEHPPPHHPALPAAHQRQDRALPPDHGPRMGPRPQLPLKRAPSQPPERLARALQPPATALSDRQPATHQPRSQPLKAGQLASAKTVLCAAWTQT